MDPTILATWAAAIITMISTVVLGLAKLRGPLGEIREALGIGGDETIAAVATEARDLALENRDAVAILTARVGDLEESSRPITARPLAAPIPLVARRGGPAE